MNIYNETIKYILSKNKTYILYVLGVVTAIIIAIQLFYPTSHLLPFAVIDGVNVGGRSKNDAANQLNGLYAPQKVLVRFGSSDDVYLSPLLTDVGLSVNNTERVKNIDYPWYLRIIPLSILWAHLFSDSGQAEYYRDEAVLSNYITTNLGEKCQIDAVEPGFSIVDEKVVVSSPKDGISCQNNIVRQALLAIEPTLKPDFGINIAATKIPFKINIDDVSKLYDQLNKTIGNGILLESDYSSVVIPQAVIFKWFDLAVKDGVLKYSVNKSRASSYLYKMYLSLLTSDNKSIIASSTTGETVQVNITNRELMADATIANIESYIKGDSHTVKVVSALKQIDSLDLNTIESDDNLSQVIKNYAQSHSGSYGVSFMELSEYGAKASYNNTTQFTTASTYKLYVAYSTLLRVEDGTWDWSDQIVGGQDLLTCFDNMISFSDNACAEALLVKAGRQNITNEAVAIGCVNTTFVDNDNIKTTPADLALLLAKLQTDHILKNQASRDVLLSAMKQNVYRSGIPAGLSGIEVADKVGFLWALLHDAAIVYSPKGTYVLVILTDHSSWATIADFAKQIEQNIAD